MEMRHELAAVRYKFNDLIAEQVRLNGRDAVTLNTFQLIQRLYQFKESFFALFATVQSLTKITQVYTGEHNLFYAVLSQCSCILQHVLHTVAAAFAAGHGDGTEAAVIIASVLYFQEGTGTVVQRVRRVEGVDIFNIAGADPGAVTFGKRFQVIYDIELFGGAQYQVYPFNGGDLLGFQLGIAAGDHYHAFRGAA